MTATLPAPSAPAASSGAEEILRVDHLRKYFKIGGGLLNGKGLTIHAVDDVSFAVRRGETFGLVGESGCGKTTLGHTVIRLYEPASGKIEFVGKDISHLKPGKMRPIR